MQTMIFKRKNENSHFLTWEFHSRCKNDDNWRNFWVIFLFLLVKYPKAKWNKKRWLLKSPSSCQRCEKAKASCGQKICLNENGHAKTFANICLAYKYLRSKKSLKMFTMALGDCKALFTSKKMPRFETHISDKAWLRDHKNTQLKTFDAYHSEKFCFFNFMYWKMTLKWTYVNGGHLSYKNS